MKFGQVNLILFHGFRKFILITALKIWLEKKKFQGLEFCLFVRKLNTAVRPDSKRLQPSWFLASFSCSLSLFSFSKILTLISVFLADTDASRIIHLQNFILFTFWIFIQIHKHIYLKISIFIFRTFCLDLLAFTLIQLFQYWRPQKSTKTLCGPCKWTAQGVDSTRAHQQIIIMPGKTKLSGWCDVSIYHK